jgi:hypothetical protein
VWGEDAVASVVYSGGLWMQGLQVVWSLAEVYQNYSITSTWLPQLVHFLYTVFDIAAA